MFPAVTTSHGSLIPPKPRLTPQGQPLAHCGHAKRIIDVLTGAGTGRLYDLFEITAGETFIRRNEGHDNRLTHRQTNLHIVPKDGNAVQMQFIELYVHWRSNYTYGGLQPHGDIFAGNHASGYIKLASSKYRDELDDPGFALLPEWYQDRVRETLRDATKFVTQYLGQRLAELGG